LLSCLTDYNKPVSVSVFIISAKLPFYIKTESGNIIGNEYILGVGAHKLVISQCKFPLFKFDTADSDN
jgi:hypothetical protein